MAYREHHELVQFLEIVVIVRKQDAPVGDRLRKVDGVMLAEHARVGGRHHVVAAPLEQRHQNSADRIVVEVEPHAGQELSDGRSLARSSCVSSRGLPWYL